MNLFYTNNIGLLRNKIKTCLLVVFIFFVSTLSSGSTYAAWQGSTSIVGNSVTTGVWSNIPAISVPGPGDVVINEIMWMGTTLSSADEWLELRNMTNDPIDISLWSIEGAGAGSDSVIIPAGVVIPANSFYLISNFSATSSALSDSMIVDYVNSSLSFVNTGEQLTLWDNGGNVIDQTPVGAWAAGINTTLKQSMERNSVPGDGTLTTSWHTCIDGGCNDTTFWDIEDDNYGTPKATNLSENDPTASDFVPEEGMFKFATTTTSTTTIEGGETNMAGDGDAPAHIPVLENIGEENASSSEGELDANESTGSTTPEVTEELPVDTDLVNSDPESVEDEADLVVEVESLTVETEVNEAVVALEETLVVEDEVKEVEESAAIPEEISEVPIE